MPRWVASVRCIAVIHVGNDTLRRCATHRSFGTVDVICAGIGAYPLRRLTCQYGHLGYAMLKPFEDLRVHHRIGGNSLACFEYPCNPQTWTANSWHHVQIASHRDDSGVVTYEWVNFDGTHSDFKNATGNSALALGWAKDHLLLNFQLDASSKDSGIMTAYLTN